MNNDQILKLSIFTPTYNRAYLLPKLYESLCNQTDREFVWMVIDDGSSDETKKLVDSWKKEKKIQIEYFYQDNSGKHIAYNRAIKNSCTPWLMCVDSDDFLTDDAVNQVKNIIDEVQDDSSIIGIVGPRGNTRAESIYTNWPKIKSCRFFDLYEKYGFNGETVLIIRTDVLKENLFPQIDGERFIPENVLYRKINNIGEFRLFEKIIYCFEYKDDGYTKNALPLVIHNPIGYMLSLEMEINETGSLMKRAKTYAYYEAIRKNMKTDDLKKQTVSIDWKTRLASLIYGPHYRIKIKRGIRQYL